MSVSCGGVNSKSIRERINQVRFWPIKATLIIINNIITKRLIIITVSIGWEALTTKLNKYANGKKQGQNWFPT